jgi:hypothetical protein
MGLDSSQSCTTIRPPGRVTRTASTTAAGRWSGAMWGPVRLQHPVQRHVAQEQELGGLAHRGQPLGQGPVDHRPGQVAGDDGRAGPQAPGTAGRGPGDRPVAAEHVQHQRRLGRGVGRERAQQRADAGPADQCVLLGPPVGVAPPAAVGVELAAGRGEHAERLGSAGSSEVQHVVQPGVDGRDGA